MSRGRWSTRRDRWVSSLIPPLAAPDPDCVPSLVLTQLAIAMDPCSSRKGSADAALARAGWLIRDWRVRAGLTARPKNSVWDEYDDTKTLTQVLFCVGHATLDEQSASGLATAEASLRMLWERKQVAA